MGTATRATTHGHRRPRRWRLSKRRAAMRSAIACAETPGTPSSTPISSKPDEDNGPAGTVEPLQGRRELAGGCPASGAARRSPGASPPASGTPRPPPGPIVVFTLETTGRPTRPAVGARRRDARLGGSSAQGHDPSGHPRARCWSTTATARCSDLRIDSRPLPVQGIHGTPASPARVRRWRPRLVRT